AAVMNAARDSLITNTGGVVLVEDQNADEDVEKSIIINAVKRGAKSSRRARASSRGGRGGSNVPANSGRVTKTNTAKAASASATAKSPPKSKRQMRARKEAPAPNSVPEVEDE